MTIDRDDLDKGLIDFTDLADPHAPPAEPIPPGEHLAEFMADYGLSARALGRALGIPHNRVLGILAGRRTVTAETALRLGRYFGTSAELWLNLQTAFDLEKTRLERGGIIAREVAAREAA